MTIEEQDLGQRLNVVRNDGVEVEGLFVRVPNGYTVIAQGLNGKLRCKGPGLRFFYPWDRKYLYYRNNVPIDFKKENYKSSEGFEIIVDTAVTYSKSDVQKYHKQRNGVQQLRLLISEILRTYISKHTFDEISNWAFDIKTIEPVTEGNELNDEQSIAKKLKNFSLIYGINVESIIIEKAELTDELKRSKEEDELNKARNRRMVETAEAELEATKRKAEAELELAKRKAEADKLQGEVEAEILERKVAAIANNLQGANTTEKLKVIKAYLLGDNANYTFIENATDDPDYAKIKTFTNGLNSRR